MKRMRLRLRSTVIKAAVTYRPKEYLDLRFWWLHHLRQLRAQRRIAGTANKKDMKVAQRELVRLRREHI